VIDVENGRCAIARDIDVREAIPIEVAGDDAERIVSGGLRDAALVRDITEGGAFIVIEKIAIKGKAARPAIHSHAAIETVRIGTRFRSAVEIELQVIGDEEIQLAVIVVVDEGTARVVADAILFQVHLLRHIFKAPACQVAI
jgi:hypothetical protein